MTNQKTAIDDVVAELGFRADPESLDRAKRKLKELGRQLQGEAGERR